MERFMYKIANRTQFQLISYGPYEWLKRNKPNLLDKHFPIIDTAAENKKKLLGLESKPKCSQQNPGERKLWLAFIRYIDPKNGCYDPSFDQLIRKKQPAWFIDTTAENKKKILKAKDRPSSTAKDPEERRLGIALIGYTNKNKSAYDPTFNNLIRKTKPEWFIDTKIRNKEILLKLKHRPSSGPSRDLTERGLAQKLLDYTTKTRGCYDPEFDELIRKTKPEWFINTTTEKKNRLLKLSDRPSSASEDRNEKLLAAALRNYIDKNSGSYDPAFDKLIRKTKPHWFIDTAAENKKVLLKLENKPSCHSKDLEERRLGTVLGSYTRKTSNSYDPEFDKLIRKTKPHWFIDTTAENKKELLKLEDRPSCAAKDTEEKMSGLQLSRYTNPNSGCYDPEFDKLIRKAKPEWFVNTAAKNK